MVELWQMAAGRYNHCALRALRAPQMIDCMIVLGCLVGFSVTSVLIYEEQFKEKKLEGPKVIFAILLGLWKTD